MMTMKTLESWAISAYADNELESGERAEVEQLIAQSPEAQAELAFIRRHKQALKQAFGGVAEEPVPLSLLRAARPQRPAQTRTVPTWTAMAASLVLLALGAGGGWYAGHPASMAGNDLMQAALGAHEVYAPEQKHPVEVAGDDRQYLQQWLSKRIGVNFSAPDLSDQGYTLLGGRLLAEQDKPAALLMYEDASKRRLSVYLASNPAGTSTGLDMNKSGKFVVCTWKEPDMVYAFVGEQTEAEMKQLAAIAHNRFES